jgi:hypothetical protein
MRPFLFGSGLMWLSFKKSKKIPLKESDWHKHALNCLQIEIQKTTIYEHLLVKINLSKKYIKISNSTLKSNKGDSTGLMAKTFLIVHF